MEKAQQRYEQAKQKLAEEMAKAKEEKRRAETHHKCVMGGLVAKYLPEGAPERLKDRAVLWNEIENIEKRKDAPAQSALSYHAYHAPAYERGGVGR